MKQHQAHQKTQRRQHHRPICIAGLLLIFSGMASAWTEKDCKEPERYGKLPFSCAQAPKITRHLDRCTDWRRGAECVDAARLVAQQQQADGQPATEAQRLARLRDILSRQKAVRFNHANIDKKIYDAKTDAAPALCQARLKDLREGRDYVPIEPVYVLDDEWEAADPARAGSSPDAPRLPAAWNHCAYNKDEGGAYMTLWGNLQGAQRVLPPFRLYELSEAQRPGPEWRYMVDMTLNNKHAFAAFSLDDCQETGSISSYDMIYAHLHRQQSWALTRYQGQLLVPSIVDGASLSIDGSNSYCSWTLHSGKSRKKK